MWGQRQRKAWTESAPSSRALPRMRLACMLTACMHLHDGAISVVCEEQEDAESGSINCAECELHLAQRA